MSHQAGETKGGPSTRKTRGTACLGVLLVVLALTCLPGRDAQAAFPGANGKIAFMSDRDRYAEIYVMNADGSVQLRLTNKAAGDADPAWSPDGRQIVFDSTRDGEGEVYVMNADGSGQLRLTNNAAFDAFSAWSPDGQRIAFA